MYVQVKKTETANYETKFAEEANIPDVWVLNAYANISRFGRKAQEPLLGNFLGKVTHDVATENTLH